MNAKWGGILGLLVLLAVMGGCQTARVADLGGRQEHLFGPLPLPVGEEDLGYFAYVPHQEQQLLMFDHAAAYVRTYTWDVEDNRRPGRSYQRRRTFSQEFYSYYR